MRTVIRNITKNNDIELELPISERDLSIFLNKNDEYIIVDYDLKSLDLPEYCNIHELNEFLLDCREKSISDTILGILGSACTYQEVREIIEKNTYCIINFSEETAAWNNGSGGDFHDDYDKGILVHEHGVRFEFESEYPIVEKMRNYIQWVQLWYIAESKNWEAVTYNNVNYLLYTPL